MNPQQSAKILVVEDDSNVAAVLEARLENYGYKVCAIADTGPDAIQAVESNRPDLVLMDILLKGDMNGIEAAEHININQNVPIIFLTCSNSEDIIVRAIQTSPYGYVVKPYDNSELRAIISVALAKYEAAQERDRLIAKLQTALQEVKKLSGLLPICASCKQIRDDKGSWHPIENYIADHSEADFSHGVCPTCAHELYPELFDDEDKTELNSDNDTQLPN